MSKNQTPLPKTGSEQDQYEKRVLKVRPNGPMPWKKCKHEFIIIKQRKMRAWEYIQFQQRTMPAVSNDNGPLNHARNLREHYCNRSVYGLQEYIMYVQSLVDDLIHEHNGKQIYHGS